ncbi:hypothetical protein ACLF3G_21935 [Falsiroseomonas sp. HC035]|uniref:hypothetical protein n=1 Tax=Falsiroseomonas sp. HC035 TaxID=3390999 RepID=UPI003D311456
MAKARKLKVFQAHFGFFDTVVAAPSQAAAMQAWGVHRNVFADGQAKLTTNEAAVAAANAHPGTVLKRPVGSDGPFEVEPTSLPELPDVPPRTANRRTGKPAATKAPPPPPPPDRSMLTKAEAALRAVEERRKTEEAKLDERQAALDAEKAAAEASYVEVRRLAEAKVAAAQKAYREAGGRA